MSEHLIGDRGMGAANDNLVAAELFIMLGGRDLSKAQGPDDVGTQETATVDEKPVPEPSQGGSSTN